MQYGNLLARKKVMSVQHCPLPCRSTRTLQSSSVMDLPHAVQMDLSYLCSFYKFEALTLMHKEVTKKLNYFQQMLCNVMDYGVNNMEVLMQI